MRGKLPQSMFSSKTTAFATPAPNSQSTRPCLSETRARQKGKPKVQQCDRVHEGSRRRVWTSALFLVAAGALGVSACAGKTPRPAPVSKTARSLALRAEKIGKVEYEEDFVLARQLYAGLPHGSPPRAELRQVLLTYLLTPLAALETEEPSQLAPSKYRQVERSFLDALKLFDARELENEEFFFWSCTRDKRRPNEGIPSGCRYHGASWAGTHCGHRVRGFA